MAIWRIGFNAFLDEFAGKRAAVGRLSAGIPGNLRARRIRARGREW
jgi:hypothetical protein